VNDTTFKAVSGRRSRNNLSEPRVAFINDQDDNSMYEL